MAAEDHTRVRSRLEQTIEAERGRLLQGSAVLRCLYEVLLYAEGEDAIRYAEAAHLVSSLIDESVAQMDRVKLAPQIEELMRARCDDDEQIDPDLDLDADELEDIRVAYEN
jgi:hypothetical protein